MFSIFPSFRFFMCFHPPRLFEKAKPGYQIHTCVIPNLWLHTISWLWVRPKGISPIQFISFHQQFSCLGTWKAITFRNIFPSITQMLGEVHGVRFVGFPGAFRGEICSTLALEGPMSNKFVRHLCYLFDIEICFICWTANKLVEEICYLFNKFVQQIISSWMISTKMGWFVTDWRNVEQIEKANHFQNAW